MNPFRQVIDSLWEILESNPNLVRLVPIGNRIRFDNPSSPKQVISSADLPELAILPAGGTLGIRSNSSSSEFIRKYNIMLTSSLDLNEYDEMLFEVYRSLMFWDSLLCKLTWPYLPDTERHYIVQATLGDFTEGLSSEDTRGINAWTGVIGLDVQMSFSTQTLRVTSKEFIDA